MIGNMLGPYRVLEKLGEGGMGEVYRARDERLDRTVAIKLLPAALSGDPVRRERFEREARTIATLVHPHVCALYDVGHQGGVDFLVFEHLEGETLEARLRRGPLPLDQALRYGVQLADALDLAHRRGIVHRDVKPANVMITSAGVKLLDFGLARLHASAPISPGSTSPLETSSLTAEHVILGTVQYMAPEQVEGREADHRTDVFALGAVLHEMATGERAFKGESAASQMAAILTSDPPAASALRPGVGVPLAFDHLVQRCLAKDPQERWQSARDVAIELEWIAGAKLSELAPGDGRRWRLRAGPVGWIVAAAFAAACVALTLVLAWKGAPRGSRAPDVVRFTVSAPEGGVFSTSTFLMALSPDGRRLAFVASASGGVPFLWIRSIESTVARALPGTEDAQAPFWSPDGRYVAFVAGGALKRIDVEGGNLLVLAADAAPFTGAWGSGGTILFYRHTHGLLGNVFKVAAQGGPVEAATALDSSRGEVAHGDVRFLADGRRFVYTATGRDNQLCLASLDSTRRLNATTVETFDTRYVEPGYLVWHRGGTLVAQPFDLSTFRPHGQAVPIARQVRYHMGTDYAVYSVSDTGVLAFRPVASTRLGWFNRHGGRVSWLGPPGAYSDPVLSHDGKRLAVCQLDPDTGTRDIWVLDLAHGTWSRLAFDPADEVRPVWSPDDTRILFASSRRGFFDLFVRAVREGAGDELLESTPPHKWPIDWSADGRFILYKDGMSPRSWLLPVGGARAQAPPEYGDSSPGDRLSPDGRWLAFSTRRAPAGSAADVYVSTFPAGDHTWRVSTDGGIEPKWRRDGRELFYLARDGRVMAVEVTSEPGTAGFRAATPRALFQAPISFPAANSPEARKQFDVTPDGQRFLINQPLGDTPITVVVNWTAGKTEK